MQEILSKLSPPLHAEPDIAFAYLFGSMARGRSGALSDVDVAVYFDPAGDPGSRFKRRLQLMVQLGRALQRDNVDVVPLQDAPVDLAFEILAYGRVISCQNAEAKVMFVFETLRRYHDGKQRRKFEWDVIRDEIRRGRYGYPARSHSRPPQEAS